LHRVFFLLLSWVTLLIGDNCKLDFQVSAPDGERLRRFAVVLTNLGTLKDYRFQSSAALIPCGFYRLHVSAPGFASFVYNTDLYSSGTVHAPLKMGSVGGEDIEGRMIRISLAGAQERKVDRMILMSAQSSTLKSYYLEGQSSMRVVAPRGELLFVCLDRAGEVVKAGKVKVQAGEPGEGVIDLN
jgi:hypothetical protein